MGKRLWNVNKLIPSTFKMYLYILKHKRIYAKMPKEAPFIWVTHYGSFLQVIYIF